MKPSLYLSPLEELLQTNSNPKKAMEMEKYLKNKFNCFGIQKPMRVQIFRTFLEANNLVKAEEVGALVRYMWTLPKREYQYLALQFMDKHYKKMDESILPLCEELITHKSWWDTVDLVASRYVGDAVKRFPEEGKECISRWKDSENFWLRRTSILYQLKYKKATDVKILEEVILLNDIQSPFGKEFFIEKAIGWALREYAKVDKEWVAKMLKKKSKRLSALSVREAKKHFSK